MKGSCLIREEECVGSFEGGKRVKSSRGEVFVVEMLEKRLL